jgi:hypothetical protein
LYLRQARGVNVLLADDARGDQPEETMFAGAAMIHKIPVRRYPESEGNEHASTTRD